MHAWGGPAEPRKREQIGSHYKFARRPIKAQAAGSRLTWQEADLANRGIGNREARDGHPRAIVNQGLNQ